MKKTRILDPGNGDYILECPLFSYLYDYYVSTISPADELS